MTEALTQPFSYCGDEAKWQAQHKWWTWAQSAPADFRFCQKPAKALIRLRTNKLLAGIVSYGAEDASNAITQLTVHREGAHGDYFPVGTFDLDPRASMSRLCFDAPFATKSLIIEVVRFDGQLVFNFNLLVVS